MGQTGIDLFDYRKQFSGDCRVKVGEPRGIAAWSGETCNKTATDRVSDYDENDRNFLGGLSELSYDRRAVADYQMSAMAMAICCAGLRDGHSGAA